MFSATHSLKGLSCLNSPGTPQRHSADLRRQPNFAEKSVIAAISCVEQRSFKIPQLPALREVVSESAQQKRRFFLLLFLSSSANSQNEAQTRSKRVGVRMAAALSGKRAHSGSHGQTGGDFLFSLSFGPRAVQSGCGRQPAKSVWLPVASQTLCLPCRKVGNLRPDTMQTAYLSSSRKGTKMVLSTRRFSMEGRYG